MIDRLLAHDAIGWDFDGTLIDHPKSELMHSYILANPEQRHVIITFRTHGWQNDIFHEMLRKYPDAPGPERFDSIRNISDRAWERFERAQRARKLGYDGPVTMWENYYVKWKGMVCKNLAIPVLIDDKPEHVVPGCEEYHITYLHPDQL